MKQPSKHTAIANAFGTLGYLSVFFQWVWALLLLLYPFIVDGDSFLQPSGQTTAAPSVTVGAGFSPLTTLIAVLVVVLLLAATVITLIRLPKTIGKRAGRITHSAAAAMIPALTKRAPITKKERQRLSHVVILGLKLAATILPLFTLVFAQSSSPLNTQAIWLIGTFSAACSLVYFAMQQLIAYLARIPRRELW